jgi:formamidopyrimidine-DNA glycosylase
MPELPEVETMRRGVLPIVGSTIADVARTACPRKPIEISPRIDHFRRRAVGRQVIDVSRAGKRVLVMLDTGDAIVFEPRMTGLVLIADPPDETYLRVRIALDYSSPDSCLLTPRFLKNRVATRPTELLYWDRRGLGNVRLLTPAEQIAAFGPPRLGPDALAITLAEFRANLARSRRAIKVALLDQRAIAGVGNLYASEMLHRAAIHPATPCDRVRATQWEALHVALGEVLHDAIAHEGSTLSDGTYRNALNKQGGYQNCHRVYDREGESCPACKSTEVRRIVQAQRATFYCPKCQRAPRGAKQVSRKRTPVMNND